MSYAAIQCSHATHIASCCSPLLARQGAYLWNAMSMLGSNVGMNGSSLDVYVGVHQRVVFGCLHLCLFSNRILRDTLRVNEKGQRFFICL